MLVTEPKQGSSKGIAFILRVGGRKCYHIHHWVLCLVEVAVITASVYCARNHTFLLYAAIGALLGGAASDLRYTDFLNFTADC